MTRTAREFTAEKRSLRLVGLLIATVLFGGVTAFLWSTSKEEPQMRVLALAFSVGMVVLVAATLFAALNMGATVVRIVMVPARPVLSETVEFYWNLPDAAEPLKSLELSLEEFKQGSQQEPGRRGTPRLIKRHPIARVHGEETLEGETVITLPDRDNTRLRDYELRVFDLVVKGRTNRGVGPRDRYSLGPLPTPEDLP